MAETLYQLARDEDSWMKTPKSGSFSKDLYRSQWCLDSFDTAVGGAAMRSMAIARAGIVSQAS